MDIVYRHIDSAIKDLSDPIFINIFIGVNLLALTVWIISLITGNSSQGDRLWPIMPTIYSYIYLYVGIKYMSLDTYDQVYKRLLLLTVLITAWSVRLTWHFIRKGYYRIGHEDYRWTKVRKSYGPVRFFIFNLLFIGFFQHWVLFSLNIPFWFMIKRAAANEPLNILDYVCYAAFVFFFLYEAIADEQQWNYQTSKYNYMHMKKMRTLTSHSPHEISDFERGFLIRGLFKYSRHPNYFGDLGLWWTVYFFGISSQFTSLIDKTGFHYSLLLNWSIIAILVFTLLFQCSTDITEKLSSRKYPEYKIYQSKVFRIIPFITTYEPIGFGEKQKDK